VENKMTQPSPDEKKYLNRLRWWNNVMRALGGEVELTYNPEYQDVPNGLFDLPHGTVICMPIWYGKAVMIETWLKENDNHRYTTTVRSTEGSSEAAKAIKKAWA
jgi:hypothetical protein